MLPRMYQRPFQKPDPMFRSGAPGGRFLRSRISVLRSRHRRSLIFAFLTSAAFHGVLGYAVRTKSPSPPPELPESMVGYREGIRILTLAPIDPSLPSAREQSQATSGSLMEIQAELAPEQETTNGPGIPTPRVQRSEGSESSDQPFRIELREDWSVDPSSPEAAYSDQFQPLRLIVPEYPELAFAQDIQGLVKLEAEVGTNGKVLGVHVLEADDGSLALSAAHALLLWEFRPFVYRGEARPFRIVIPFRFRIKD